MDWQMLAMQSGIQLGDIELAVLQSARTRYGNDRDDWLANWKRYCLESPPYLSSCHDFEWLDVGSAVRDWQEWLGPRWQDGLRLMPFARTGAGDLYALLQQDTAGSPEVVLLMHDSGKARILAPTLADFMADAFLEACCDLDHLDDEFTAGEIAVLLQADWQGLTEVLPPVWVSRIAPLLAEVPLLIQDRVLRLAGHAACRELRQAAPLSPASFAVRPRWECRELDVLELEYPDAS